MFDSMVVVIIIIIVERGSENGFLLDVGFASTAYSRGRSSCVESERRTALPDHCSRLTVGSRPGACSLSSKLVYNKSLVRPLGTLRGSILRAVWERTRVLRSIVSVGDDGDLSKPLCCYKNCLVGASGQG